MVTNSVGVRSLAATLGVAMIVSLAACGSDDAPASATTPGSGAASTSLAPEDVIVSDAEVTTGLAETIDEMQAQLADPPADADDTIDLLWYSYEGTIKHHDEAAYLDFEDALALFRGGVQQGDAEAMQGAIASFTATRDAYLVKHPG